MSFYGSISNQLARPTGGYAPRRAYLQHRRAERGALLGAARRYQLRQVLREHRQADLYLEDSKTTGRGTKMFF